MIIEAPLRHCVSTPPTAGFDQKHLYLFFDSLANPALPPSSESIMEYFNAFHFEVALLSNKKTS